MKSGQPIQVITIYSASRTPAARGRVRLLALFSLVVAAIWLVEVAYPRKILDRWNTVNRWITGRLLMAGLSESTNMMGTEGQDPWVALGLSPPPKPQTAETQQRQQQAAQQFGQHMAVLTATSYIWTGIACVAGGWLALAGLIGLTGRRPALRMLAQAGWLMIFSTLSTLAAIYVAIHYGGMPPIADVTHYAKIAGVQGAYPLFLIIATRLMR